MTPDELIVIADEMSEELGCSIRSFAALCAVAAVCQPRIAGVAVYRSEAQQCRELQDVITRLEPLSCHNELFARIILRLVTERTTC